MPEGATSAGSGLSGDADTIRAAEEAAGRAMTRMGGGRADWAVVFATVHHFPAFGPMLETVSAKTGAGMGELKAELGAMLRPRRVWMDLTLPASDGAAMARVRTVGEVVEESYEGEVVHLRARIPPHARGEFARFENAGK